MITSFKVWFSEDEGVYQGVATRSDIDGEVFMAFKVGDKENYDEIFRLAVNSLAHKITEGV